MNKTSAQLEAFSASWHIARCDEGACPQDSNAPNAAKKICMRSACNVGQANLESTMLEATTPSAPPTPSAAKHRTRT